MKKTTKKQIITISTVAIVGIALFIASIMLGTKSNKDLKGADTKVEAVEKDLNTETKKEDSESVETEKDDTVLDENALNSEEAVVNQTVDTPTSVTTKKETSNIKNNTKNNTTNKVTASKPSSNQTVTQPNPSHTHKWTEVKTQVTVPEKGHYETIFEYKTKCCECDMDLTYMTDEERDEHYDKEPCKGGYIQTWRDDSKKKWVVDTPATTESRVTGYKCSCGATREKTQYAGMYSLYDKASWDRLEACYQFFKKGLAGNGTQKKETYLSYGNWDSVVVSNGSTDGAWMWIFIREWPLDDYSYLQDSVKEGIIDQEEAKQVEAVYEEIPSIFKGAIERVAPQGGTELYNYVAKLIIQAKGNPDNVPYLSGAKGTIPENIPGLYVTIEETRGGFSLMFWAE